MVPLVAGTVYAQLQKTGRRYIEPFVGGGAVALNLGLPDMILGDTCGPLIEAYQVVVARLDKLWATYSKLIAAGWDEKTYYTIRARRLALPWERAAQFLYLNATCFNGVYRENARGEFNVPWGMRGPKLFDDTHGGDRRPGFRTREDFEAFARATATSQILCQDFRDTIELAHQGDCIFCDPPYLGTFSGYTADGFGLTQHIQLAAHARAAYDRGADVIITNSDIPEVRALYTWAYCQATGEKRRVNRRGSERGPVGCLLITTIPDVLGVGL